MSSSALNHTLSSLGKGKNAELKASQLKGDVPTDYVHFLGNCLWELNYKTGPTKLLITFLIYRLKPLSNLCLQRTRLLFGAACPEVPVEYNSTALYLQAPGNGLLWKPWMNLHIRGQPKIPPPPPHLPFSPKRQVTHGDVSKAAVGEFILWPWIVPRCECDAIASSTEVNDSGVCPLETRARPLPLSRPSADLSFCLEDEKHTGDSCGYRLLP